MFFSVFIIFNFIYIILFLSEKGLSGRNDLNTDSGHHLRNKQSHERKNLINTYEATQQHLIRTVYVLTSLE